jgi:Mg-chelatase subunit ChlD
MDVTKQGYTHIEVVLDRSGSMATIKTDTEGGFATFLTEQQAQPGEATVGLRQFDTEHDVVYGPTKMEFVKPFVLNPRGGTALLDAMGAGIVSTGEWLASLPEDQRPDNVIFVVITDGQENRSKEFTREQVMKLVTEQQQRWGWSFLFLAANQDAIATGAGLGLQRGQSLTYDSANVGASYSSLSASVSRGRAGGQSTSFTEEEREGATSAP